VRKLIIAVTIIGMAAVIGPIVVGTRSFEGTVVDKPYERGLDWDKERAQMANSGLSVSIANADIVTGANRLLINVTSGSLYNGPLMLKLTRPDTAKYDSFPKPEVLGPGQYSANVDIPVHGKWLLDIDVVHMGNRLTFTRELHAQPR
jgi:nitrogen fixation protein FixH